jgi:hypothetical protein
MNTTTTTSRGDLDRAGVWLRRHGFTGASPTPLLAARLAVRRRTQLAAGVVLAGFIMAVALTYRYGQRQAPAHGFAPYGLLVLTLVVVGLVAAQSLLYSSVRRTDRRLGAALPRRVTHPVRLGWRTVLGLPRAALALTAFTGAVVLALRTLAIPDGTGRYAAMVLLIGVCGVAVGMLVQLRDVLSRPVVADDEVSLDADFVMRIEDARDAATPALLWALPAGSVLNTALGWWGDAWLVFVALNVVALALITFRTVGCATMARNAARQVTGGTVAR